MNGTLPETRLQDLSPALVIRQRDVDQLIQSAGTQDGGVDDIRPVGGANDEHVLLGPHSVHLCQDLGGKHYITF